MFTYLGLRNFRAFEAIDLELRPLTIFVGPNNSGKSSILSSLRILSQTAASDDYGVPLLLNGPLGDFGTYQDLVYENKRSRNIGITLGIDLPRRVQEKEARLQLVFAYRPQRREVVLRESNLTVNAQRKLLHIRSSSPDRHKVDFFGSKGERVAGKPRRAGLMHFLLPLWGFSPSSSPNVSRWFSQNRKNVILIDAATGGFLRALRTIEYIGPFRAEPQRTNLFSGEKPTRVGVDGSKAVDFLASDYLRRGKRKKALLNRAVRWLRQSEIAKDYKLRPLSDRHYETLVQHPVTEEFENLADVGYGISQVLPVITGGYNLSEGATFIVEEPEIHLHPRAQAELGDFFRDLYRNSVQCILETHSEHLILRIQRHVAEGRIKPQDVCVYFIYAVGGRKTAAKLTIGEDGLFQQQWPRGFFEERLKEVIELARATVPEAE